jgi:cyanophycinase-like exopeptidase
MCPSVRISLADEPGYKYFALGQPGGVPSTVAGYALMGGGQDQDAAFQWMCDRAGGGDFVILRASGTDAYNSYIRNLCPALSSVETLIVTSRQGAGQPFVAEKIRIAAAVFITGGSQDRLHQFLEGHTGGRSY